MPIRKERLKELVEAARSVVDEFVGLRGELLRLAAEDPGNGLLMALVMGSVDGSLKVKEAEIVVKEEERWLEKNWKGMERKKNWAQRRKLELSLGASAETKRELGLIDTEEGTE